NETIAEVDTDKATMEMTSLEAGTLLKIIVPGGENARLGQTIGIIGEKGEDFSALLGEASANGASAKTEEKREETTEKVEEKVPVSEKPNVVAREGNEELDEELNKSASATQMKASPEDEGRSYDYQRPGAKEDAINGNPKSAIPNPKSGNGRMIVSPIAARMAAENGVDLKSLKGTGPGGRIIKRDVETALESRVESRESRVETTPQSAFRAPQLDGASAYREENASKMRQVIAQRLGESIGPIPTFYLTVEIEMDNSLEFRKQINASIKDDEKVSLNDIIVKVAAQSLTKHSWVNSSYQEKTVRFYQDADIAVAVAVEDGLITPVVRGANRKGIVEISREIKEMAHRAREKKLQPEEYTGATFSISNLGMFGVKEFTAIINPPEAAIIAVGAATPIPIVKNGEIVVRNIMNVTMSCDHRVIDGATGARFLQTFKQILENPILMLM
ncbi:MAG: dihydrolipoamide acetyltransferase family protein, partial [Pyrinomonadaceae bacterium]